MGFRLPLAFLGDLRQRTTLFLLILAGIAAFGIERSGALRGVENLVTEARMAATPREASEDIVFLAIDNRSLQEVGIWPWPREIHAEIIRRLFDLGAAEVFLDIDFSAGSNAESDAALIEVVEEFGSAVLLPAFRQAEGVGVENDSANLPLPPLRDSAWMVSVNVEADPDGRVRRYPYGQEIAGRDIESVAAMLSGRFGPSGRDFPINYSIRPQTVPVIAAIDLLEGRVEAARIADRSIVVGAHAIELRDNISVPVHGIISGAMLQILATETLIAGIVPATLSITPLLALVASVAIIAAASPARNRPILLLARFGLVMVLIEIVGFALFSRDAVILRTPVLHLALLAIGLVSAARELDIRRLLLQIAQVKVSNNQELLDRIVSDSSDAILVVDQSGAILKMSYEAQRVFAMPRLTGPTDLFAIVPTALAEAALAVMADFQANGDRCAPARELVLPRGEGVAYFEYTITASRLQRVTRRARDPEDMVVACIIARDVTVAREQMMRAEEAARSKARFLAMMSHEIRTPINGVLGMAEALAAMPLSAEHDECVSVIQSSGRSLLAIVTDILEISKLEQNVLTLTPGRFDLRHALEDVMSLAAPLAEDKGLRLHLRFPASVPAEIVCDEDAVRKIATNLVGNAIKFTERGHVRVDVLRDDERGPLTLRVVDTGIGIDGDQIDRVFDAFYQAPGIVPGQSGGTGLGLAISHTLARHMGGEVTVTSRPGEGSVFEFTFPAEGAAPADEAPEQTVAGRFGIHGSEALDVEIMSEMVRECGGTPVALGGADGPSTEDLSGVIVCREAGCAAPDFPGLPALHVGPPSAFAGTTAGAGETRALRPLRFSRLQSWLRAPAADAGAKVAPGRADHGAAAPAGRADGAEHATRLLIVDDNATNRLILKRLLRDEGFDFVEATNGAEACALNSEQTFSHILMDVSMPVMDGLEASARIRAEEDRTGAPRVPIIGVTAHVFEEDRRACIEAGMDHVAGKPVSKATLLPLLRGGDAPEADPSDLSAA